MADFWLFLGGLGFLCGFIYFGLSVYLAVFKNPAMDRFLYNDERYAEAIAAGGIPFGVMRAFEYGLCFIICRLFNQPVTNFFRSAHGNKPKQTTILYELHVVFALFFFFFLTSVYFFA